MAPKIVSVARRLDFNGWFRGLFSAAVSGGASAITGGVVMSGLDPAQFNLQTHRFYEATAALFGVNAVVSIAKFLQMHPLPEPPAETLPEPAGVPVAPVPMVLPAHDDLHHGMGTGAD